MVLLGSRYLHRYLSLPRLFWGVLGSWRICYVIFFSCAIILDLRVLPANMEKNNTTLPLCQRETVMAFP